MENDIIDEDIDHFWDERNCDRRLSRAARTFLYNHLLQISKKLSINDISTTMKQKKTTTSIKHLESMDIWHILDEIFPHADPNKCPLVSTRDILRHDEEHRKEIPRSSSSQHLNLIFPQHVIKKRNKDAMNFDGDNKNNNNWYECQYCGKQFLTRFYSDLHMHQYHPHHDHNRHSQQMDSIPSGIDGGESSQQSSSGSGSGSSTTMICPAVDWCKIIGMANCHEQALQDEPYYGRGSGGRGSDRKYIQHKWAKLAHSIPCDIKTIQSECLSILQSSSCGIDDYYQYDDDNDNDDRKDGDNNNLIINNVYAKELCLSLSCPVHRFWPLTDTLHLIVPTELEELWYREMQHYHNEGYYSIVIVFVAAIGWLFYIVILPWWKKQRKSSVFQSNRGKRLLQKNPRSGLGLRSGGGNSTLSSRTLRILSNKRKKD